MDTLSRSKCISLSFAAVASLISGMAHAKDVPPPAALVVDGIPAIPQSLREASAPYMEFRTANFLGWNPQSRGMLIATRFGNTAQIHEVAAPGADRRQLTFEIDPVTQASYSRARGDVLLLSKDIGGGEFFQLYRLSDGRLQLLTDGKSRNTGATWSKDGRLIGYVSTRRNGTDADLYLMDPRNATSDRMVAQVSGGGWGFADFAADSASALVLNYISINESEVHELDVGTGKLRLLTPKGKDKIFYGDAEYGPDDTIYVTSDEGSDFQRLTVLDPHTGQSRPLNPESIWDVEEFDVAEDGAFIAYTTNEAGISRLKLLDPKTRRIIGAPELPTGTVSALEVAPWGAIGFTLSSAKSPADAYSLDRKTLAVSRWTQSETGGLDASWNSEPALISVKSFDGLEVSGFLYRPDAAKFPGKRPLIVNIHGGPESQARPGFLGRNNFLINELGIAIFYPNVRGSTGYGKRFVAADNGPRREDSVKDIGAFLDTLAKDPLLDARRFAVTGGSYGGYMTLASAIHYGGSKLRSAIEIVGISDFVTFLTNTQDYRRDLRRAEYGDERDPKMRAAFDRISPLRRASSIKIPLMVVTGANDPRVPASEAEQIVAAVRSNGGTAWHLLGTNEGHGFAKKDNVDYQFWSSVLFWQKTLLE